MCKAGEYILSDMYKCKGCLNISKCKEKAEVILSSDFKGALPKTDVVKLEQFVPFADSICKGTCKS